MTQPIAGNQFFTVVDDAAKQFTNLNTADLQVSNLLTAAGGLQKGVFTVLDLGVAGTMPALRPNQAGIVLVPPLTVGNQVLNLPRAELGLQYHFLCTGTLAFDLVITCDTTVAERLVGLTNLLAAGNVAVGPGPSVTLDATAAVGDNVLVTAVANSVAGVCWQVQAQGVAAGAVTVP